MIFIKRYHKDEDTVIRIMEGYMKDVTFLSYKKIIKRTEKNGVEIIGIHESCILTVT